MAETLNADLRRLLEEIARTDPDMPIPVIVTVNPGTRPADVIPGRLDNEFPAISAASAKLTARQILDLSRHTAVQLIEHDGEMHALRKKVAGRER